MTMAVSDIETQDLLKSIDAKLGSIVTIMAKNANVAEDTTNSKMENVAEDSQSAKIAQDAFAEQRKWIGKLCWFWDDDKKDGSYDVLGYIKEGWEHCYVRKGHYFAYKHCEPVKPDSELIYHGE